MQPCRDVSDTDVLGAIFDIQNGEGGARECSLAPGGDRGRVGRRVSAGGNLLMKRREFAGIEQRAMTARELERAANSPGIHGGLMSLSP